MRKLLLFILLIPAICNASPTEWVKQHGGGFLTKKCYHGTYYIFGYLLAQKDGLIGAVTCDDHVETINELPYDHFIYAFDGDGHPFKFFYKKNDGKIAIEVDKLR